MSSAGDFGDVLLNTSRKGIKVGLPRQKAYCMNECMAITRGMIAAKNDPLRGSDQKFEDFLSRFYQKYDNYKRKEFPYRSVSSLYDKFKEIRHDCGQFTGIVSKIQQEPPASGQTQSDEADMAKVPTFIH